MKTYDFVIVGAGIVGLSVARELKRRRPECSIAIVDKEERVGVHASGRNSGVLHCGIFYGADTLKAKVCSDGAKRMMAFADEHNIAYQKGGKVVLATDESQLPVVEKLLKNAKDNDIRAERINRAQLQELEPFAAEPAAAIYCPDTASIDIQHVLKTLITQLTAENVTFIYNCQMTGRGGHNHIETTIGDIGFGYLYNCAGGYADTVARYFGLAADYVLLPFKGIYWKLSDAANSMIRSHLYPVPDVTMPFLGIHLSRVSSNDVYLGPTAIPALGRENYGIIKGANLSESFEVGWSILKMYFHNENNFRKLSHVELLKYQKHIFFQSAKKLCPALKIEDMVPTAKVGIRPQLANRKTNKIEMDYIIEKTDNTTHVLNAISPAFTSSFAFAEMIVDRSGIA